MQAPHWIFVLVLLGGLAALVFGTTQWNQPSVFENDQGDSSWHSLTIIVCLILWTAWIVGLVVGGLLHRQRRSPRRES